MSRLPGAVLRHLAALRGVRYTPSSASALLRRNLWIYGVGGLIIPFAGIKLLDMVIRYLPGMGR